MGFLRDELITSMVCCRVLNEEVDERSIRKRLFDTQVSKSTRKLMSIKV